jgi:hypothetical protein
MAIAAEHLYEACTCEGGMRDGLRCADCFGRGIVPRGSTPKGAAIIEPDTDTVDDELEDMSVTHLRSRAKDLGLSAGTGKTALVKAIREATADSEAQTDGAHDDGETDADDAEAE